ncbi:MAG: hypothetical protein ACK2UK_11635 [Candidatus Promineifilaceae bacterium]
MAKELCKLKKALKKDQQQYFLMVHQPTHVCGKCGRAANSKKLLCDPLPIKIE